MKRLITTALTATLAIALAAVPVSAQQRGSGRSGGGASSSMSRGGGSPSRSSASPSRSYSSPSRSSGSYGSPSRSGSSYGSSRSHSSASAPSRSYGSSQSRSSASSPSRSYGSQSRSNGSSVTRGGLGTTRPQASQPSSGSVQSRSSNAPTRSGNVQSRSGQQPGSAVRSSGSATRGYQTGRPIAPNSSVTRSPSNHGINPRGGNTPGSQPRSVRPEVGSRPRNYQGSGAPGRIRMDDHRNVQRIHPRHRDPMPFNRPARFWDGGPHYFGYRVHYLPSRYEMIYHWGVPYYLCDGLWYRMHAGCYYVCRPPFGHVFVPDVYGLTYGICRFAYYYDVYQTYRAIDDNARAIAEQNATIAANNAVIAQQNADIALNRERAAASYTQANNLGLVQSYADATVEYFYDDGVFFTKGADGQYTVIVPPAGALVQELPDDYDTVTIDGKQYYKVDDTIYEMTIVDGSAYFQVLGQMTGDLATKYASLE